MTLRVEFYRSRNFCALSGAKQSLKKMSNFFHLIRDGVPKISDLQNSRFSSIFPNFLNFPKMMPKSFSTIKSPALLQYVRKICGNDSARRVLPIPQLLRTFWSKVESQKNVKFFSLDPRWSSQNFRPSTRIFLNFPQILEIPKMT